MTTAQQSHQALVIDQFGAQAAAYVASAVHAAGEDLQDLAALAAARRPARVLDMGCGGGHVSYAVAPSAGEVVAYDLSSTMLAAVTGEAARRGLTTIMTQHGAVESLPFENASFDLVCSRYSAHHWHDLAAALREARRVLREGGLAVFIDVVSPGSALLDTYLQAVELLRDPSHVRDYSAAEWRKAVAVAGFRPGKMIERRLHLDFETWITRIRTPLVQAEAIRAVQRQMAVEVAKHFAIETDGSFTLDTMTLEASPR